MYLIGTVAIGSLRQILLRFLQHPIEKALTYDRRRIEILWVAASALDKSAVD